ncbi:histidine phosphatase family protein [bacterium]|nr:histidine phosphatase family protein [bacterium]
MSEELHPPEVITSFYLIRHGHTEPVEHGRLYNDPAVELTEKGIQQAHLIADWLSKQDAECLLSSCAIRVVSTAKIVSERLKLETEVIPDLNEWDVGNWEGSSYLEVKKTKPDEYFHWVADPIENAPPQGESIRDLYNRSVSVLDKIIASHPGKKIALISHAGVIRAIIAHALGMPLNNFWRINIPAGSVSRVDFSPNYATVHFLSQIP